MGRAGHHSPVRSDTDCGSPAETVRRVKILFITIIALVIPSFFVLVFVMSAFNRLTGLRNRCREMRQLMEAFGGELLNTPSGAPLARDAALQARRDLEAVIRQYNAARTQFPASLLASMWGFREMELLAESERMTAKESPDKLAP